MPEAANFLHSLAWLLNTGLTVLSQFVSEFRLKVSRDDRQDTFRQKWPTGTVLDSSGMGENSHLQDALNLQWQ